MKHLLYCLSMMLCFSACQQQTPQTSVPEAIDNRIMPDPDLFVGKHKAQAMVLGVVHFDNPGLDSYQQKYPFNILEPQRQEELEDLLQKLARYKPTKILLERSRIKSDSATRQQYEGYLNGTFSIEELHSEDYQIGFKLAKRLGHSQVYCSDSYVNWCGAELDWDNYDPNAYLREQGNYEKANRYDYDAFYALGDSLKANQSLTEHLIYRNSQARTHKDHQAYLTNTMLEGAGDNYVGADAVARWYRRNLHIFANTYDIADFDQEERLLLIYGSGHVWQLKQLLSDSPDFDYVEVNDYLRTQ